MKRSMQLIVILSLLFVLAVPGRADSSIYIDEKTGVTISVPDNWTVLDLTEESATYDVLFVSEDNETLMISYGSVDFWETLSASERENYTREDLNNSLFSNTEIAILMDSGPVDKVTYGGKGYFSGNTKEISADIGAYDITNIVRFDNGWLYWFRFTGAKDGEEFKIFQDLLRSVDYPSAVGESKSEIASEQNPEPESAKYPTHATRPAIVSNESNNRKSNTNETTIGKEDGNSQSGMGWMHLCVLFVLVLVIVVVVILEKKITAKRIRSSQHVRMNRPLPEVKATPLQMTSKEPSAKVKVDSPQMITKGPSVEAKVVLPKMISEEPSNEKKSAPSQTEDGINTYVCYKCGRRMPANSTVCPYCGTLHNYEAPIHHLKPGTMLMEKYLVGKALGQGGFGITYAGRDLLLDIPIALKEYYPSSGSSRNHDYSNTVTMTQPETIRSFEHDMKRFLNEARTLAKFSNEAGIVSVRDFFRSNGTAYIVMEYLDGITLKQYVQMHGPMQIDSLLKLLRPVMDSLGRLHTQGIIHRDISPDNIILLKTGQLKLLDFGAAREWEGDNSLSVVLKRGYAPEEQYRSKGAQGPWTDIYSLCATIYKCITGKTPEESLERIYQDQLVPPSLMGIFISQHQEAALLKGLNVRRSDRFQSMHELIDALWGTIRDGSDHNATDCTQPSPDYDKTIYASSDLPTMMAKDMDDNTVYHQN